MSRTAAAGDSARFAAALLGIGGAGVAGATLLAWTSRSFASDGQGLARSSLWENDSAVDVTITALAVLTIILAIASMRRRDCRTALVAVAASASLTCMGWAGEYIDQLPSATGPSDYGGLMLAGGALWWRGSPEPPYPYGGRLG